MYNEVKLYCKSEGVTEYLRSEVKLNSQIRDERKLTNNAREDKRNTNSMKKAG